MFRYLKSQTLYNITAGADPARSRIEQLSTPLTVILREHSNFSPSPRWNSSHGYWAPWSRHVLVMLECVEQVTTRSKDQKDCSKPNSRHSWLPYKFHYLISTPKSSRKAVVIFACMSLDSSLLKTRSKLRYTIL